MAFVDVDFQGKTFLHLLGKTGTGKSSTGNTILGKPVFNAKAAVVTEEIQRVSSLLGDRSVEVVDGPALVGTDKGVSQDAFDMFRKVIEENKNCVHVFLIVCRYGEPFSWQDQAVLDSVQKTFGHRVFQDRGIAIMTYGDSFAADTEDEGMTFRSWCQAQSGTFSELLRLCQGRVRLVDNSRRAPRNHREDVIRELIQMINGLDKNAANGFSLTRQHESSSKTGWFRNFCNIL